MTRQSNQKNAISQINNTFDTGFNQKFYDDRVKAYEGYASPELSAQYQQTRNNLSYDLARRGLTQSTAGVAQGGSLNREMAKKKSEMGDVGLGQANELRSQVESTRANLVNQAISGADPGTAGAAALAASTQFKAPSAFGTIGNLFDDWSKIYVGNKQAQAYSQSGTQNQQMPWGSNGTSGYMVGGGTR